MNLDVPLLDDAEPLPERVVRLAGQAQQVRVDERLQALLEPLLVDAFGDVDVDPTVVEHVDVAASQTRNHAV